MFIVHCNYCYCCGYLSFFIVVIAVSWVILRRVDFVADLLMLVFCIDSSNIYRFHPPYQFMISSNLVYCDDRGKSDILEIEKHEIYMQAKVVKRCRRNAVLRKN